MKEREYWEDSIDFCLSWTRTGRELIVTGSGTTTEVLLKYVSGLADKVRIHLREELCETRVWVDGLVHGAKLRQYSAPWERWLGEVWIPASRRKSRTRWRRCAWKRCSEAKARDRKAEKEKGPEREVSYMGQTLGGASRAGS